MQPAHRDSYFLNPEQALQTAMQQNRVQRTLAISGLQICYLGSDQSIPDAPPNLIQVPPRETLGFFVNTRMRLPSQIVIAPNTAPNLVQRQTSSFKQMLRMVEQKRLELLRVYAEQLLAHKPEFRPGEPLRIFIAGSRLTTVMQYASRDLANAFRALGHEVLFLIEKNELEEFEPHVILHEQLKFKPHLVVNINHRANGWLHPDVFNLCWWQDPMPELRAAQPLIWRERDLLYSYTEGLDDMLRTTGATRVARQGFCIDTQIFHAQRDIPREEKIVFIGSGVPASQAPQNATQQEVFTLFEKWLKAGETIDEARCHQVADQYGIDRHFAYWKLFYFAMRRLTVRWLCRQKKIPVEIYGRYWDLDEVVRPHFKGEIPHGDAVAGIYRSAKYALVCHPIEVQSQRLAESAACGCIPVVFDSRHSAHLPTWDDECLFFKTEEQLLSCLSRTPETRPDLFSDYYSFDKFADRVLRQIEEMTGVRQKRAD